jgi:D-alanyl-D-alanine carboxypeptidase/D-alanyl-D-alanine-endopeptidase (penicillin-binding protein 4)
VNFKAIAVQFAPELDSRRVRITAEPPLAPVEIINKVTLTEGACGDWPSRLGVEPQNTMESGRLVFTGTYARDCGERARNFSVLGHRAYVGALFTVLWRELGGGITGTARDGQTPAGARLLVSAKSPSLSEVVRDINKYSNNVMARQLFLTLGGSVQGGPATADKARSVVRQWLVDRGLSIPELSIENGSGLSRSDRISARSLAALLVAAFTGPVMPEFAASLPLVAVDGTMRKRLGQADVAGRAHIKTGSLNDVRAIAGYVLDARGRRSVVVFIVNHPRAAAAQAAQDALLKWVYDH